MKKSLEAHNAELEADARRYFPPDPGKTARVLSRVDGWRAWVAMPTELAPRAGFLNYDGKMEFLARGDGSTLTLLRWDMTDTDFSALAVAIAP